MKTRSFPLPSDEAGRSACCTAIPPGSDEAGPDASYARAAIAAPLPAMQANAKHKPRQTGDRLRMSASGTKRTSQNAHTWAIPSCRRVRSAALPGRDRFNPVEVLVERRRILQGVGLAFGCGRHQENRARPGPRSPAEE